MLMVCPSCGKSFEVAGHLEAEAAHKCPACGYAFGGEEKKTREPPRTRTRTRTRRGTSLSLPRRKTGPPRKKTELLRKKEVAHRPPVPESVDVGTCELVEELSRRGAGILYGARDAASGTEIIVKAFLALPGSQADDSARWAANSRKMIRLRHPRLVRVLGVGVLEGVPCAAIERVEGVDLEESLKKRPGQLKFGAQLVLGVLEGLEAAHAAGIVHGDIKPSNILVGDDGKGRLTDFGHSPRAVGPEGSVVDSEHVRSSLPYAAPEVLNAGPEAASRAADVYSVGAVLYRLAAGEAPFSGLSPEEQLNAIREGHLRPPEPPSRLTYELQSIAVHAMEKEPQERYPSVRDLAADLRRFMSGGKIHAVEMRRRGRKALKGAMWIVLVAGLASSSYYAYSDWRTRRAERTAAVLLSRAKDCAREGEPGEVERLLTKALELPTGKSTRASLHSELGTHLLALGRCGEAVDEFLKAANALKGPRAFEAEAMAEVARALGGAPEEALERLLALSRKAPVAGLIAEAARRLGEAGNAETAARFYEAFSSSGAPEPERADALIAYARMKTARGAPEEARGLLLEAVRLDGGSRKRAALALAEAAPSRLSGAEKDLILGSPEAVTLLAENYKRAGRTEEARRWFEKLPPATEDARLLSRAFVALGELDELGGDLADAGACFKRVLDRYGAEGLALALALARARLGLARLELRKGEAARALPVLKDLAEKLPPAQAAEARLLAAFCLRATGVPSEAARLYANVAGGQDVGRDLKPRALLGRAEALLEAGKKTGAEPFLKEAAIEARAGSPSREIARCLAGGLDAAELDRVSRSWPLDERAHALYAIGLRLEGAGEPGARAAYSRCIEASRNVSWYRILARSRSR